MRLVSAARYADLNARYQRMAEAREDAEKLAAQHQATITRQAQEITRLRDERPDAPVQHPQPAQGDAELRRQLHLARKAMEALTAQCADLQKVNEVQARQLRSLAEKAREAS